MWTSSSKTSFRIKGLPVNTTKDNLDTVLEQLVESDCNRSGLSMKLRKRKSWRPRTSLALQGDGCWSTVSCPSKSHKERLMKLARQHEDWREADIEDSFSGITVLHSPTEAFIDICVVHGLNGNGIDTFSKKREKNENEPVYMWLRDFVPLQEGLQNARTMTYDYNSRLFDRKDTSGLDDWASSLLREVDRLRDQGMKDSRPVIFIGYSLGGIVIREAASELCHYSAKYRTLTLQKCGFVFLGTPHSGTVAADYGPIKLAMAEHWFGIRSRQLVSKLGSFNSDLLKSRKAWHKFYPKGYPPVVCFSEARKTTVFPNRNKMIVAQESAGWMDVDAIPIPGSDHHTICTFGYNTDRGYNEIVGGIIHISQILNRASSTSGTNINAVQQQGQAHIPGLLFSSNSWPTSTNQVHYGPPLNRAADITAHFVLAIDTNWKCFLFDQLANGVEKAKLQNQLLYPKAHCSTKFSVLSVYSASVPSYQPELRHVLNRAFAAETLLSEIPKISSHDRVTEQDGVASRDELNLSKAQAFTDEPSSITVEEAWDKSSVLSIDGGGVRGLASLLIIEALMERVARYEREASHDLKETEVQPWMDRPSSYVTPSRSSTINRRFPWAPRHGTAASDESERSEMAGVSSKSSESKELFLPCHYFDYIAGTSTGGLIAIMLSRLRMSVTQCIQEYKNLSAAVFGRPRHLKLYRFPTKYDSQTLEHVLKELEARHTGHYQNGNRASFTSDEDLCKTVVVAVQSPGIGNEPKLFRSYDHVSPKNTTDTNWSQPRNPRNPGPADNCLIWEAARATSAAPMYFKPVKINGSTYVDGGLRFNNPGREIIGEVVSMHSNARNCVNCLVSIGTGRPRKSKDDFFKPGQRLRINTMNRLKKAVYDSISVHEDTESYMIAKGFDYFRFDVEASPGSWKSSQKVSFASGDTLKLEVVKELKNKETMERLNKCAWQLVKQRIERAKDKERWRRFALVVSFTCHWDNRRFKLPRELRMHCEHDHTHWWETLATRQRDEFIEKCEVEPPIKGGPS